MRIRCGWIVFPLTLAMTGCSTEPTSVSRTLNPEAASCSVPAPPSSAPASLESTARHDLIAGGRTDYAGLLREPVAGACTRDHTRVDHCFNADNPPAPSIARSVSVALPGHADGKAAGFPEYGGEHGLSARASQRPARGDAQVMPFGKTSNDGRVLLELPFGGWPQLSLLRPELVGYDQTVADAARTPVSGQIAELHALAWFNPADTSFDTTGDDAEVWNLHAAMANPFHGTLCEASSSAIDADARSPYPCRARYGAAPYGLGTGNDTVYTGLCYDLTFLAGVSRGQRKNGAQPEHSELRSAPLTVFVREPYGANAGRSFGDGTLHAWIYPQRASKGLVPDEHGVVTLPDQGPYDLGRILPWSSFGSGTVDLQRLAYGPSVTVPRGSASVQVPTACYVAGGAPNERGPAWCAYLWDQRRTSSFDLDLDGDAVVDTTGLTRWDGRGTYFLFEPTTDASGRLLMINFNNGLFYSVQASATACAADGFRRWSPLSSMPIDPAAQAFPLARSTGGRPFRDPTGAELPFGSIHRFAYQWLDRAGANVILAMMNEQRDAYRPSAIENVHVHGDDAGKPNPSALAPDEVEAHREDMGSRAGHEVAVLGAWTEGKLVTLDNGLNASDFGGRATFGPAGNHYIHRYRLDLYRDRAVSFVPRGASAIQSAEHVLGLFDALRPVLPFDVVWSVSSNTHHNAEIAFDDFHTRDAVVIAPMNAPMTFAYPGPGQAAAPQLRDGFVAQRGTSAAFPGYKFDTQPGSTRRALLQNVAGRSPVTSLRVRGGARIEPVAMGGVLGRGVYLDEHNDFIDMGGYQGRDMPRDFYAGLWVDPRPMSPEPGERVLFYFPDHTYISLRKAPTRWEMIVRATNTRWVVSLGDLLEYGTYHHVAVMIRTTNGNRVVTPIIDGNRLGDLKFAGEPFRLDAPGPDAWTWFAVGSPYAALPADATGMRRGPLGAWVDDLRIYRVEPEDAAPSTAFAERACNYALGTQVAARDTLPARLQARADAVLRVTGRAPALVCEQLELGSHGDPADLPRQVGRDKLCIDRVHRDGRDARCQREVLLGLTAPVAEAPRPDTRGSKFCTSCHGDGAVAASGLGLDALADHATPRWLDRRRQPLNPPATLALPGDVCDPASPLFGSWYSLYPMWAQPVAPGTWATDFVTDGNIPWARARPPALQPPWAGP